MISRFFIDRPIFASVLSIVLLIAGTVAMFSLPISLYPPIAPPTVQVSVTYPGASAEVVADTVAAPIEQQVNGVDDMIYMSSTSDNTGYYNLTVTFGVGTNLDMALVNVQNRVNLAVPQLPDAVRKQGLTIKKKTPDILLVINFYSPDRRYDDIYLSNYAMIHVKDEVFRLEGVSDINFLGERDYSIRVWLDPQQLAARNLSTNEVVNAIRNQNFAVSPGAIGQQPAPRGQVSQMPLDVLGRLTTPEQFGNMVVRAIPGGANEKAASSPTPSSPAAALTRLRDVARLEFGALRYDQTAGMDDKVSVALAVYQLPGSNALDVAKRIRDKMKELEKKFPEGLAYQINYDTTPFIRDSIKDVVKTLFDAIILVAIVVLVFLQNWRATIIPLIAVPVAIVGTFAAMAALGISINTISLFGLVLAIGIVVDDAIVVVENVERWLEEGLTPRDAARKAMDEVTGPVVAVALVLCAVFVPCAFITGITGQFFRQFAVTIAVSTVISAFNSLTLSPALAAILLRHRKHGFDWATFFLFIFVGAALPYYLRLSHDIGAGMSLPVFLLITAPAGGAVSAGLFLVFNRVFDVGTAIYTRLVGWIIRLSLLVLVGYGGLLYLTYDLSQKVPKGFIPVQDQGYLVINVQLPDSASVQRTDAIMKQVDEIARKIPGVAHTTSTAGYSFLLSVFGSNYGGMFVVLEPFDERKAREKNGFMIMFKLREELKVIKDAVISVFPAPPVKGLGTAGGFKFMIEDRGDLGAMQLDASCRKVIAESRKDPDIAGLFTMYSAGTPQLYADIDRFKTRSLGVQVSQVNEALQAFLGSLYVNNMNAFGRFWQVNVMADLQFRNRLDALNLMKVRNVQGDMVPLGTLINLRDAVGPGMVMRYNLYRAAPLNGNSAPGVSSGDVMDNVDELARKNLPRSMAVEWTELSYLQRLEGEDWRNKIVFPLAVVLVFLVLAAQYESWSLPLAVILVVPMCLLCSLAGLLIAANFLPQMDLNIFTQIGFVVLVGLASKNAILIVEFARQLQSEGKPVREATLEACRLRLRPILMTSFAFILGVVPLVIAIGAGAEMRRALGVAVFSGMLGVTLFGIFLTPVFFFVIQWLADRPETSEPGPRLLGKIAKIVAAVALPAALYALFWWGGWPHLPEGAGERAHVVVRFAVAILPLALYAGLSQLLPLLRRGRPRLSELVDRSPPAG